MTQKATIVVLCGLMLFTGSAMGQTDTPKTGGAKKAPRKITDIYEKEESGRSFTAVVKMVRRYDDNADVNFVGQNTLFTASMKNTEMINALERSLKGKVPVTVTVDEEEQILTVQLKELPKSEQADEEVDIKKLFDKLPNPPSK